MPESPMPSIVHRSRKWRFARWLFVSVISGVLTVAVWNLVKREWVRTEGNRTLAAEVATTDRDDPDWRWEQLNAARVRPPEDKNGAVLIPQIKKLSRAEWGTTLSKDEWKSQLDIPPNVRYSPAVIAQVRRELTESADAVALAHTLKDSPFGHREIVLKPTVFDTLLKDTQDTRHATDLLRWDVVLAVEDGDIKRVADDLLAMLNTSRSIGDEPFAISQLVRMATRTHALRSVEWSLAHVSQPLDLAPFQVALAADAEEPLLLYGLRGDRAVLDRLFENLDSGATTPGEAIDRGFRDTWARVGWWHYRGHLPADRAYTLNWMSDCVGHARRPIDEQPSLFATLAVPPKDPTRLLSGLFLTAADRVAHAHWRSTAEARCAVAGIACERFRLQHGRWPEALRELVPAFLPEVALDPFDGQSLRYVKSETGVVVHSVGQRLPQQAKLPITVPLPVGFPDGVEFGFRLWNPEHRRQPPRPDQPPEQDP